VHAILRGQSGLCGDFSGSSFFVKVVCYLPQFSPTRRHSAVKSNDDTIASFRCRRGRHANVSDVLVRYVFHTDLQSAPLVACRRGPSVNAGAGLRLGELRCWGRRAWPLAARQILPQGNSRRLTSVRVSKTNPEPWSRCVAQETILRRNGAKDNRKIPWYLLLCGPSPKRSTRRGC